MALTIAHHSGRERFSWEDLVESITTLESGTAIGIEYIEKERARDRDPRGGPRDRGPRLHEGLRVDAAFDQAPRRLGRAPPGAREGGALRPLPERDVRAARLGPRRDGRRARLLRRELDRCRRRRHVRHGRSRRDGRRARRWGRSRSSRHPKEGETEDEARRRILDRLEAIGLQIMNRMGGGGPMAPDPIAGVLSDPSKRTARRADHRPGLRRRAQPRGLEPRGAREDRGRPDGAEGDLRRRAPRPARLGRDPHPGARLQRRVGLAAARSSRVSAPERPGTGSSTRR